MSGSRGTPGADADATTPVAPAPRGRRHRVGLGARYWRLWGAAVVSGAGDGLAAVAFPLLAATVTRDPASVAGLLVAGHLPWLVFGLVAGALADRLDRIRLMAAADVVRAGVLAAMAAAVAGGRASLWLAYLAVFALGSAETLFTAASHAALPGLVPLERLDRANGYLLAAQTVGGELAGPAVGGLLFAAAAAAPFVADGASFAASALLLVGLRAASSAAGPPVPAAAPSTVRADVVAGLRWFWSSRLLRLLALVVGVLALCQAMAVGVLVLFGLEVLGLSGAAYGALVGLGAVGNVVGGLLADRVKARLGPAGALTGGALVAAVAYLVLAATSSVVLAGAALVAEAFAVACGRVASISLRQTVVPDEYRGRVTNAFLTVIWGVVPVGSLAGGLLARSLGLRAAFLAAFAVQALVALAAAAPLRRRVAEAVDAGASAADSAGR